MTIKATLEARFLEEKQVLCQEVSDNMQFFQNEEYSQDPYLNSAILLMPIMSAVQAIHMDLIKTLRVENQKYGLF